MHENEEYDDIPGLDDITDEDVSDLLQEAVDNGEIDGKSPGYGVALAVLDGKWDDLSEKQQYAYAAHVLPILKQYSIKLAVKRRIDGAPD